jgi:hypothetical protein
MSEHTADHRKQRQQSIFGSAVASALCRQVVVVPSSNTILAANIYIVIFILHSLRGVGLIGKLLRVEETLGSRGPIGSLRSYGSVKGHMSKIRSCNTGESSSHTCGSSQGHMGQDGQCGVKRSAEVKRSGVVKRVNKRSSFSTGSRIKGNRVTGMNGSKVKCRLSSAQG